MSRPTVLALCLALCATACSRGPKGSPSGSVKAFYACINAKDWQAMAEVIDARSKQRLGARAAASLAYQFDDWKDVEISIDEEIVDRDDKTATVKVSCTAKEIVNHKVQEFGCSETLGLDKEDDGLWHVGLPGGNRLSPM